MRSIWGEMGGDILLVSLIPSQYTNVKKKKLQVFVVHAH